MTLSETLPGPSMPTGHGSPVPPPPRIIRLNAPARTIQDVQDVPLKRERSVTPDHDLSLSVAPSRRLVRAGSELYTPLPPDCRQSHPEHKTHRLAWVRREQDVLRRMGLIPARAFIRCVTRVLRRYMIKMTGIVELKG
jgi:hypothetical protein